MQTKDRQESANKKQKKRENDFKFRFGKRSPESNQNKEKIHLAIQQTKMKTKANTVVLRKVQIDEKEVKNEGKIRKQRKINIGNVIA